MDTNIFISSLVELQESVRAVAKDPSDSKIIECALAGKAYFIVSGDKHLLDLRQYQKIKIVTPNQFLKYL